MSVQDLPTLNAFLNSLATCLLLAGWVFIRQGNRGAHRIAMVSAFLTSVVFLVSYLVYHYHVGSVKFTGPPPVRTVYLVILVSHIILAAAVPPLALRTLWLAYKERFVEHRRMAKWAWPIWMYVSVTGVVVYLMLYHLYPPAQAATLP